MTLPLALLDTDTLIAQLRRIEASIDRPKPKTRTLPAYVPDFVGMFGGTVGDPDSPDSLRMVGGMIAAELWQRGVLSLSTPDTASVLRAADDLLKGHQP